MAITTSFWQLQIFQVSINHFSSWLWLLSLWHLHIFLINVWVSTRWSCTIQHCKKYWKVNWQCKSAHRVGVPNESKEKLTIMMLVHSRFTWNWQKIIAYYPLISLDMWEKKSYRGKGKEEGNAICVFFHWDWCPAHCGCSHLYNTLM